MFWKKFFKTVAVKLVVFVVALVLVRSLIAHGVKADTIKYVWGYGLTAILAAILLLLWFLTLRAAARRAAANRKQQAQATPTVERAGGKN